LVELCQPKSSVNLVISILFSPYLRDWVAFWWSCLAQCGLSCNSGPQLGWASSPAPLSESSQPGRRHSSASVTHHWWDWAGDWGRSHCISLHMDPMLTKAGQTTNSTCQIRLSSCKATKKSYRGHWSILPSYVCVVFTQCLCWQAESPKESSGNVRKG
jgi:hypothetical protein